MHILRDAERFEPFLWILVFPLRAAFLMNMMVVGGRSFYKYAFYINLMKSDLN